MTITAPVLAEYADISRSQLDLWVLRGYLTPLDSTNGDGNARIFTPSEQQVARWMGLLVRHGLAPDTAAPLARDLHATGEARLGLFHITPATPHLETARSHA